MKNKILLLVFLMGCTFFATAQNYNLRIHKNGDVQNQWNTSTISNIGLSNGVATFTINGNDIQKNFSEIDSITFYNLNGDNPGGGDVDDPDTIPSHDTTTVDPVSGIHITWNNGAAPTIVNGYASQGLSITANGENVTVNAATGLDDLTYVLDGRSVDGNLIINTDKSLILYMQGLHLHSATGPAIRVVDDHRVTLHLATGTSNFISDTTNITDANHKAALQSQGKFEVQGDGALTVKGYTKHAIQSSGKTIIMNGTVNVYGQSTTGDAMNVDDFVMQDGSLTVTSLGDGIDADQGYIAVSGGTINITCSSADTKGMGCDSIINIGGGNITINMSGADSKGINGNSNIYITDGTVNVTVSGNQSKGIKTDYNLSISGGNVTVNANGTYVTSTTDISYCTGIKANEQVIIGGGTVNVTCSSTNAGGKCISADGSVTINNGTITLSALGNSGTYTLNSTTKSYTTVGIKSNANVTINGGNITMTVGGKGISADGNFNMNGGETHITTSGAGAVISGSGTSATDGYCSAGVSTDGNVYIYGGTINCTSTGKGGRGFKVDGTFNVGTVGGNDELIHVYAKTSGTAVNTSSGGGMGPGGGGSSSDYWKGLPKGIKVTGSIHINSGHVNAFCAQTSGDATGEGIESKDSIIINGGYVESNAYDDAINASNYIQINGGHIWAYARGNDAIDCNGAENSGGGWGGSSSSVRTIEITGGTIIASGTEVAVDDCGDRGGYISATNCTLVLIGGNMGISEATPQMSGQKLINITSTSGGGGYPGGGGSGGLTTAQSGFTVKNSSGTEIMTFKWPTVSTGQSGFEDTTAGAKPGPGGSSSSGIYVSTPQVQAGTYTVYKSPTITGGTSWHGLYTGATSTGGTSSSVTAQ
ncbi:MAG: carbohydrate-binding domain-containing protein [Bacteroidales bacterium]|nr:carbohydrate-binding domain-containing protein [Bacteroidales bacterium]